MLSITGNAVDDDDGDNDDDDDNNNNVNFLRYAVSSIGLWHNMGALR